MIVETLDIKSINPRKQNPRTHSQRQIEQIARSITQFGFTNPLLIDDENTIVAGHGRLEAARLLQLRDVPVIRLRGMSEAQLRAYVIADNRLAEKAGWDREILAIELQYLSGMEIDFDLSLTGFELPEIDLLLAESSDAIEDTRATIDESEPPVSKPGDLWLIGKHKLLCADALDASSYKILLNGELAEFVFTDPPFNVPIQGHVSRNGAVSHREFIVASGEMSTPQFTAFLARAFENLAASTTKGSIHQIVMDWRHMREVLDAGRVAYSELKNLCVWTKTNAGMGSFYRSQHELIFVFKSGNGKHINNIELGRHGRNRSNVWIYPGANAFGTSRDADLAMHPTVKPVMLVADAILDCSNRGGIVLDAFAGSGTTLLAAEKTGRRGRGIEIDPRYCDVILRRFAQAGIAAVHAANGESFDALNSGRDCDHSLTETNSKKGE